MKENMKLRMRGQAVLAGLVAAGFALGMTSCSNDHTVGYVYVTGTQYNQVGAYKEYNNKGNLAPVQGSPWGSGGTNPIRELVASTSRFLYVLNAGTLATNSAAAGGQASYTGSNISLFSIGGYGQLSFQFSYTSQGTGPQRIAFDSTGTHLYVLDEYAPVGATTGAISNWSPTQTAQYPCADTTGIGGFRPVGDITAFSVDSSTGRLTLITNSQQQGLTYFPVGCNPVDFHSAGSFLYTMDAGSATNNDLETVFVYGESGTTGQLTLTQNAPLATGAQAVSTITSDANGSFIYLIDSAANTIYPFRIGTAGALNAIQPLVNSASNAGNPQQLISVGTSGGSAGQEFVYIMNAGPAGGTSSSNSDVTAYDLNQTTGDLNQAVPSSPFGLNTVSGATCIFEDPSNQYIYIAGANDSQIAARKFDPQTGLLSNLQGTATSFTTVGTPSWCLGTTSAL
jgi:6-phosphogluconolactonase